MSEQVTETYVHVCQYQQRPAELTPLVICISRTCFWYETGVQVWFEYALALVMKAAHAFTGDGYCVLAIVAHRPSMLVDS